MSRNTYSFLISLCLLSFSALAEEFSLNKYLGHWNEIYSIPNSFQKDCFNVSADYSLKLSGKIKVVNICRNQSGEEEKSIEGEAEVIDLSKKYLKVYFFRPFGLNIFGGDYYILGLDENYEWALVGTPNHKYGWVLSRQKQLTESQLKTIKTQAEKLGFDWTKFNKTQTLKD